MQKSSSGPYKKHTRYQVSKLEGEIERIMNENSKNKRQTSQSRGGKTLSYTSKSNSPKKKIYRSKTFLENERSVNLKKTSTFNLDDANNEDLPRSRSSIRFSQFEDRINSKSKKKNNFEVNNLSCRRTSSSKNPENALQALENLQQNRSQQLILKNKKSTKKSPHKNSYLYNKENPYNIQYKSNPSFPLKKLGEQNSMELAGKTPESYNEQEIHNKEIKGQIKFLLYNKGALISHKFVPIKSFDNFEKEKINPSAYIQPDGTFIINPKNDKNEFRQILQKQYFPSFAFDTKKCIIKIIFP